ncbi:MAG TPA: ABC transporter ATP-binding protein [Paracoccaceae bacterium]|nr:ABC transporter ATP-binding protein [Paracoccaceae bacterium]
MSQLLEVDSLVTEYSAPRRTVRAVDGVSFSIRSGEIFGIVGESGCGKSATCRSIIQLFAGARARIASGSIRLNGREMVGASPERLRRVRGREIAMVFQDPMTALNPTMTVGRQIRESVMAHGNGDAREARDRALDLMRLVRIPNPEQRFSAWPHELSGGLRQRIVIAIALANDPALLLADEPTTALDVTVQDQVLRLLLDARDSRGAAVLLVTHDLGVVAQTCDRVAVMYAGRIVETGSVADVLKRPAHPYTQALLKALPGRRRGARLEAIAGAPPDLAAPPQGCRFLPRCPVGDAGCASADCVLVARHGRPDHLDACVKGGRA